jgi:hypothetical protein
MQPKEQTETTQPWQRCLLQQFLVVAVVVMAAQLLHQTVCLAGRAVVAVGRQHQLAAQGLLGKGMQVVMALTSLLVQALVAVVARALLVETLDQTTPAHQALAVLDLHGQTAHIMQAAVAVAHTMVVAISPEPEVLAVAAQAELVQRLVWQERLILAAAVAAQAAHQQAVAMVDTVL